MKLHLPLGLRSAILACFALVSGIASAPVTATLAGSAVVATFICSASPAQAESVTWDANWGAADAPSEIPDANVISDIPSGYTFLSATGSSYSADGQTIVRLADTAAGAEGVAVIGGAGATSEDPGTSEGPITVDTWMKVTGGTYSTLVGGSYAQNYSGGEPADFTGDSHILLTTEGGTTPTVDFIIGGNYQDSQSASFTGNSYISVEDGTVNGSIVGGGTSAHIQTAVFNGDSNIWVYTPLTGTAESRYDLPGNLIIGGNAAVANYAPKLEQTGDSSVTVDFSAHAPVAYATAGAGAMEKIIIGDAFLLGNTISTHTGDASVSISGTAQGGGNISFAQPVVAGSWFTGSGTANLSGDAELTIDGGAFSNAIVGGVYLASSSATGITSTIGGDTTVTLGGSLELGGSSAMVVGGSYINAQEATVESGDISIAVNEGTYAGNIIGGSWISEGSGATTQTTGDIDIDINGGSISGTIYGGSWTSRSNADSANVHGDVSISLTGGSILGNVYAGGGVAMIDGAAVTSGVTSASTLVEVSDAVVLGSASAPIVISGGVENSNTASLVTGERTLWLSSSNAYANLDNATFHAFTEVENAADATLNLMVGSTSFTKDGAGTLSINGANSNLDSIAELTVEEGTLNTGTAWLTNNNQGLTSIAVGAAASLVTDGLMLADGAALTMDVTGATSSLISVGATGGLSIGGAKTLNLTLAGVDSIAAGGQATLLSWGNAEAPFALSDVTWVNKTSADEAYTLSIVESALVLSRADGLVWDGEEQGTWGADDGSWVDGSTSSTGKVVNFNTPLGASSTVSITGAVAPQAVIVNNAADTTYTFEQAAGTDGAITGATSLTKNDGGTLVVALENSYTGGTTINGGTVEAAAAGALGTGAVTLNGGQLLASAEDAVAANALVFNGGALSYTADEMRDLGTAGITHGTDYVPVVSVAADNVVSWLYSDAAVLQDAVGNGMSLSGGGTLELTGTEASVNAALQGNIALANEGTTLEFGSTGAVQLGAAGTPVVVSLSEGTMLRVEVPQADAASALHTELEGTGTLEFANSTAAANNVVRLSGDNSEFAGSINLGEEDVDPALEDTLAVILDYSEGSPVGGAGSSLNLSGLGFATELADGTLTTTAANINVNEDTTQFAQTAGLNNVFSGAVAGDWLSTWTLDATTVTGGQTNTLTGDLSGFDGELEATGAEGSIARWVLGGEDAVANAEIELDLYAENAYNEFVIDCATETTLSGDVDGLANLTQQGAGTLVLTGVSESSGTLTIAEGSTVQLGSADDDGMWGDDDDGFTLAGAGTLSLVNGALSGTVVVDGTPQVVVNVAAGAEVDMDGNDGSLITGAVTIGEGGTLTNVGSSILDRELNLTLGADNVGGGQAGTTAMVQFVDEDNVLLAARAVTASLGSTTEAINLDASADGVVALLRQHYAEGTESYLTLTNGQLITAADYSNVNFVSNMSIVHTLGLQVVRVEGGSVVVTGTVNGVYIAGEEPTEVTGYANFGGYQSVAVLPGETLTLNLDGAPDGDADGAGAVINNLLGGEGSALVVNNTDTTGEVAVVFLNNSLQTIDPIPEGLPGDPEGADTTFGGSIAQTGGEVEFVKEGSGTLSVGGAFSAYKLTAEEGEVELNASGNEFDVLALNGGDVSLTNGTTSVEALADDEDGGTLSIAEGATLATSGLSVLEDAWIDGAGTLQVTGELYLAEDALLDGVALALDGGTLGLENTAVHEVASLSGDGTVDGIGIVNADGTTEGASLSITGVGGRFSGSLTGSGTLTVEDGAYQIFAPGFSGGADWSLVNNDSMAMDFVQADGNNGSVVLDALTLGEDSITVLNMNTDAATDTMLTLDSISAEQGATVFLSADGVDNIVKGTSSLVIGSVSGGQPAGTLSTLTMDMRNIVFLLLDAESSTLSVDAEGNLLLNFVESSVNKFSPLASNPNSAAGAEMLWNGARLGNAATGTDIRRLLEALVSSTDAGAADRLLAAAAGSGVAVLSSAFAADIERQLRGIRNRTTMMSGMRCVPCKGALNSDAPAIAAWIDGEGDHRKMKASGMLPGYSLTSWGGTIGMDMSCSERFVGGLAFTALYGDLKAHSADNAKGDFNRYYVSAFGRMKCDRWQHTLLGTMGRLDGDLKRTVDYGTGSYHTRSGTKGWGFGLMYEIGYDIPMDENATFSLQPVVNVNWRIADVNNHTESGSDAALRVGTQIYNVVTFGAGFRTKGEVGETLFNRRAFLEGRALVKVDAGDRHGEALVSMLGGGGATGRVRSEKLGAVGVELGAGLSIPLGEDAGSFFIDGSAELRNSYSNLNGTVGYRFEF